MFSDSRKTTTIIKQRKKPEEKSNTLFSMGFKKTPTKRNLKQKIPSEEIEEIDYIRKANVKKARETKHLWGNLFWNMKYPPVPTKYMDEVGEYTRDTPLEEDY